MNQKNWTIWALIGVAILSIAFFVYRPLVSADLEVWNNLTKAKGELNEASNKKNVLSQLEQSGQLEALKQTVTKYIPENSASSDLILELSGLATANKLKVEQLSMEDKKTTSSQESEETKTASKTSNVSASDNTKAKEVGFAITVSGDFANVLSFLQSSETASRLINIRKVVFSQTQNKFTAEMEGRAYWKKGTGLESTLQNITISKEIIAKFQNLKTYGAPINLQTEAGFGRANPFANY